MFLLWIYFKFSVYKSDCIVFIVSVYTRLCLLHQKTRLYNNSTKMILVLIAMALAPPFVSSHKCYSGWEQYKNSCYGLGEEHVDWQDAAQFCELYNSYLVEINDEEENNWLVTYLKGKASGSVWTGGSERHHRGVWEWIPSRRPFGKFSSWYGNEPLGVAEDCLEISAGLGYKWNDLNCLAARRFVCERSLV
uniref:C-type lectin domain-containing protein n=1 Tax=Arion vulgaris TaxID=1028688 RepID=A0A0B6ZSS2_9EUPU